MKPYISALVCALVLGLTGCERTEDAFGTTDSTSTSPTDATDTTDSTTATSVRLGNGVGTNFVSGQLSVATTSLSAGGQTSVTATLVDSEGNLYTEQSVDVMFTSPCTSQNLAALTSPVASNGGFISTTYQAKGCAGTDTITATVTVNETTLTATGTVTVQAAELGSLEFLSADPVNIGLKGTGLNEISTVRFRILDSFGNPVANQTVTFNLETDVGGITIDPASVSSGSDGTVQTYVSSGTVPTPVRVTASSALNPSIATMSDELVISTGIPDQNSFTTAVDRFNVEGFTRAGEEVTVTAFAADRFNNPVPDGTAVYFTTEGGAIQPSCNTVDGKCSVIWTSQNPRPAWLGGDDPIANVSPSGYSFPGGGRATVRAHMIGEESFIDANANGVFDDAGPEFDVFLDLPEPFLDENEDGVQQPLEPFADFDKDGAYDGIDGVYNGLLCAHSSLCSSRETTYVWQDNVIVMSTSFARIETVPASLAVPVGETRSLTIYVWDENGNLMAGGTTVEATASTGTLSGKAKYTVADSAALGPSTSTVYLKAGDEPDSGEITVKVTSPSGSETYLSVPVTVF